MDTATPASNSKGTTFSLADDFRYLESVRLICCIHCQVAVFADGIRTHLRNHQTAHFPHSLKQAQTTQETARAKWPDALVLADAAPKTEGLQRLLNNNNEAVPPFPYLPISTHGLLCSQCPYVCLKAASMDIHQKRNHGEADTTLFHRENIANQRFMLGGPFSNRFSVLYETEQQRRGERRSRDVFCNALEAAYERRVANNTAAATKVSDLAQDEIPPLAQNAGWAALFHGYDFEVLSSLVSPPPSTMAESSPLPFESIVWHVIVQVALTLSQNHRDAADTLLFEMARTTMEPAASPFTCPRLQSSIVSYARTWAKIILFFFRVQAGETHDCPGFAMTEEQRQTFDRFKSSVILAARDPKWKVRVSKDPLVKVDEDRELELREEEEGFVSKRKPGKGVIQEPFLPLEGIYKACLDFCLSLFHQTTMQNDFEQPMIIALSCLGVTKYGWVDANQYTQYLSAVISLGNIMFLQSAIHLATATGQQPPPVREELSAQIDLWKIRGKATAFQWVLNKRLFGFAISKSVGGTSRYLYENGTVHFHENHIHFNDFATLVQKQVTATQRCLADLIHIPSLDRLPIPPFDSMFDNPNDDASGHSIVRVWERVDKTKTISEAQHWLADRVMEEASFGARYVDKESKAVNMAALRTFLQQEQRLLDHLLVLIHLSYGAPARGTELTSIRHAKTTFGDRNIVISHGHVCIVIDYNKRGWTTIYRFLPTPVGQLIIWYLTFVLPFTERIRSLLDIEGTSSAYFFPRANQATGERAFDTPRLSKHLGQLFRQANCEVNVKHYRQLAAIWIRDQCVETMMAQCHDRDQETDEVNGPMWAQSVMDAQFGHSSQTGQMHYGRLTGSPFFQKPGTPSLQGYMAGSQAWFKFVGFSKESAVKLEESSLREAEIKFDKASYDSQLIIKRNLERVDLVQTLRRMYGVPDAQFRGKQLEALRCIVSNTRCVVVVLPTGAGKSLLYQLPAFTGFGGLTIVVSPYRVLLQDQVDKCTTYRIAKFLWDPKEPKHVREPPREPHLLFVTPESFVTPRFMAFMNEAIASYRLHRIVIDEFHECRTSFRAAQRQLPSMLDHTVQVVALTATLEPRHEDEIVRLLNFPRAYAKVVRDVTTQKNIAYGLVRVDPPRDRADTVAQMVRLIQDRINVLKAVHDRRPQFLVFCNTVAESVAMAKALGGEAFYANLVDGKDTIDRFLRGTIEILCSTNAAAAGLDGQGRIFVLYNGAPDTLQEFTQGGGRGGRDGALGALVLFSGPHIDRKNPDQGMKEFLRTDQCHRIAMDRWDDSRERMKCDLDEVPCDFCVLHNHRRTWVCDTPQITPDIGDGSEDFVLVPASSCKAEVMKSSPPPPQQISSSTSSSPYSIVPAKRSPSVSLNSSSSKRLASSVNNGVSRLDLTDGSLPRSSGSDFDLDTRRARQNAENDNARLLQRQTAAERQLRFQTLESKLDIFTTFCIACGGTHTANECRRPESTGLYGAMPQVEAIRQRFKQKIVAAYCACFKCLVPLTCCPSWNPRDDGFSFARSESGWNCRKGILETFCIMSLHLRDEYTEHMRNGVWRLDVTDSEAHIAHLGLACNEFNRGSQMMTMMMVHLEWMVDVLVARHGPFERWGNGILTGGLIREAGI